MISGRFILSQILDLIYRETLSRLASRFQADSRVRHFGVRQQLICMVFAQLTWRDGLRDIVECLNAKPEALYHLGFREPVAKSTLADANERRDWKLWEALALSLIPKARSLYAGEDLGLDLENTIYALDSTTIDLSLTMFPWATFRSTKSGIKLHTQIDLWEFYTIRNIRRKVTEDFWPRLHRAETHRKRNYRDKFDIELSAIDAGAVIDSFPTGTMAEILAEGFEKFEACFSSSLESYRELVAERIQKAREVNPVAVELLREFYAQEDRADHLYQQLRSIDKQWVELYSFFEPLEIVDCLEDPTKKLSDDYTLSEKPLERLKALYSDCFETAGRILVLAGSYEGIIRGHGVGVPSRRRLVPPAEFERTPNGSKPDLVSSMPFWQILAGSFDSKLRNGIGHHSWRYEAVTDTIHYENHSPSRGREDFSMPYLDFCLHVRRMFHAVTICSRYVHSVWLPNN